MNKYHLTHLKELEAESIFIIREVVAQFENPVLLFSGGKDSIVCHHLARKAYYPANVPFPLMHVDTGHNFEELYKFRDQLVKETNAKLIIASVQKSIDEGRFYKFDTKLDQRLYLRRIYKGEKEIIGKDKQGYFTRWNEMANLDEDTYRELENAVLKNEIHEVEWKTNRLVIANNFTLLHRRTPFKYESGERVIFRAYVQ